MHQGVRPRNVNYGLPLIGVLVIVLTVVREAARRYKLRRERKRRAARYYWQPKETFGTPTLSGTP